MTGNSIMIDDYLHIIKKSGWQRTHIMQAPLSLRGVGSLRAGGLGAFQCGCRLGDAKEKDTGRNQQVHHCFREKIDRM